MEAVTPRTGSSNRTTTSYSRLRVFHQGENEPTKTSITTVARTRSSPHSGGLESAELMMGKTYEDLLLFLFVRTTTTASSIMIDTNETTTKDRGLSFDILRDSVQTIKSYLGVTTIVASPPTNCKRAIHFECSTPATSRSTSGPLKKRIKQRYSLLDSTSSLPFTPSGFYDFTPDVSCRNNSKPFATTSGDSQVPSFRMPFTNMSPNAAASEIQGGKEKNKNRNKSTMGLLFSLKKAKREKSNHAISFNDFALSASATTEKNESINSFSMSAGSAYRIKLPQSDHKLRNPTIVPNFSQRHQSLLVAPMSLVRPAKEGPTFILPAQSPISSKANNDIYLSSWRGNVNFGEENRNSYMRLIRQQLEFFELTVEDVALCKARNVSVALGQVALRCRHCTCISVAYRPKGSLVVAKMHQSLYKHYNIGTNRHLEEHCPFVPKATKKMLESLRIENSYRGQTSFWQDFGSWCAQAKKEGVVETQGGLRFKSSLTIARNDALGSFQEIAKRPIPQKRPTLSEGMTGSIFSPSAMESVHPNPTQHRQKKSVNEKRINPTEQRLKLSQNYILSKKPSLIVGHPKQYLYDERNDQKGMRPTAQQIEEAHTARQQAALRTWFRRFQEFIDYKDRNGHGQVPQHCPENRLLGIWVNKQRMSKKAKDADKPSSMTDEKVKLLEKAGFIWAKPRGQESWEERFSELQKYFEKNGDCDVPTKYENNKALGRWVSTQRIDYKKYKQNGFFKNIDKNEMRRRIGLLNGLNFSWSRLPSYSLFENDGDEDGDGNNHLKQAMALTSEHTNNHLKQAMDLISEHTKSAFPKQEKYGSTTKYSRTIGNKKSPPLTPHLPHNAYDCSRDLIAEVKLEDQSLGFSQLGFSPLFDDKNFEF